MARSDPSLHFQRYGASHAWSSHPVRLRRVGQAGRRSAAVRVLTVPAGRRLRIAAHNGAPEWGGAEIALCRLLSGLRERGHEVVLFCNRDVVARGARAYGIDVKHAHLGGDIALHHTIFFARQLRRYRADVLVVGTFRKLLLAALAARLGRVPVVAARIGLSSDAPRNIKYRFVFRNLVDIVIVNARDLEEVYLRVLPEAPPPRVLTVHKGIDPPTTPQASEAIRRDLGVPPDALLIGGVGRLVAQKRFDRLLEAFAPLPAHARCVIVGEGPLRESLERRASELGLARRVTFTGHRDDVPALMSALDLLVVSSDRESMANVMLEAMASGVPVLSTPVSGAIEALGPADGGEADRTTEVLPPGLVVTPDALAPALQRLVSDPALLGKMGEAARIRAAQRFGRARMLDEWERALGSAAT